VEARLVTNPQAFYCPAENGEEFSYQPNPPGGSSKNPWPFDTDPSHLGQLHTRLGFSARPVVNWPSSRNQSSSSNTGGPFTVNQAGFWLPGDGHGNIVMPRFSKLHAVAILADTLDCKNRIVARHKTGINVLYGNGGAHWVELKSFDKSPWNTYDENSAYPGNSGNNNDYLDDGTWPSGGTPGTPKPYDQQKGLWVDLDRQ
jgi:hypothetical protein